MTLYNMAYALYMLDDKGYRHTVRIRNTYFLSLGNNCYSKAPQFYVIRILLILFLNSCLV